MYELCHKRTLAMLLKRMKAIYKAEYTFFPMTMLLPEDHGELQAHLSSKKPKTFIVKPDNASQGNGIFLIRSEKELPNSHKDQTRGLIVQRYVFKPLLIDSLKFDLRLYVLITSVDPLRVYVCDEGLARFCTRKYAVPTARNMSERTMHLANYSINKKDADFVVDDEGEDGSKRSMIAVFKVLQGLGHDTDALWERIKEMVAMTCFAMQPTLWFNYKTTIDPALGASTCFQLMGFDILLDWKLRPWLLEINNSPSLNLDAPIDVLVKEKLVEQILRIMRPPRADTTLSADELAEAQEMQEEKYSSGCSLVYPTDAYSDFETSCPFVHPGVRQIFQRYALLPGEREGQTKVRGLTQSRFLKAVKELIGMDAPDRLGRAEVELMYIDACKLMTVSKIADKERGMNLEMFCCVLLKIARKMFPSEDGACAAFQKLAQIMFADSG